MGLNYRFGTSHTIAETASISYPKISWNGFYIGALAGAATETGKFVNLGSTFSNHFDPGDKVETSGMGILGGVQAGYNYQTGAMVVGLVTDYSLTSASGSMLFDGPVTQDPNGAGGLDAHSKLKSIGTTRLNLGYATGNALIYTTGGLAYGQIRSEMNDSYGNSYDHTSFRTGWTAGVGLDYALGAHWSVKTEGLFYSLVKKTGYKSYDNWCSYFDSTGWNGSSDCGPYADSARGLMVRNSLAYYF